MQEEQINNSINQEDNNTESIRMMDILKISIGYCDFDGKQAVPHQVSYNKHKSNLEVILFKSPVFIFLFFPVVKAISYFALSRSRCL